LSYTHNSRTMSCLRNKLLAIHALLWLLLTII
jgi:hypothetical protein